MMIRFTPTHAPGDGDAEILIYLPARSWFTKDTRRMRSRIWNNKVRDVKTRYGGTTLGSRSADKGSEVNPALNLDPPSSSVGIGRYLTELGGCWSCVRCTGNKMIENIQRFKPQLEVYAFAK